MVSESGVRPTEQVLLDHVEVIILDNLDLLASIHVHLQEAIHDVHVPNQLNFKVALPQLLLTWRVFLLGGLDDHQVDQLLGQLGPAVGDLVDHFAHVHVDHLQNRKDVQVGLDSVVDCFQVVRVLETHLIRVEGVLD